MSLKVTITAILLSLFIQYVEGFETVIVVSESDVIRYDKDILATGAIDNGLCVFENLCCIYGNCSCPSLYNALTNLTSNVLINITTDVVLSSIIPLVDLANITITGHNNPTVNCNDSGGLHFISCNNCTIEGITWYGCGARNISDDGNVFPVLQSYSSSDITIKNCSFQHSIGQAVVLSEMIGYVNIDHCNFSYNKQYEDHGTAIHYNSSNIFQLSFTITNCIFSYNEGAKSVAYFGQSSIISLYLQNLKFTNNKGVPIYLSHQNLHISGNIKFYNNTAENGGGILISDYSNVTFHKSAVVIFTYNAANNNGGAIFLTNHSSIIFNEHITCYDSQTLQMESITVMFHNNRAKYGGAIYSNNSSVIFGECSVVEIADNNAEQEGGAVYGVSSTIIFEGNSATSLIRNVANNKGGAMAIYDYANITFKGNSAVELNNNSADHIGGAMIINNNCIVRFEENSTITFNNNSAESGGAVQSKYCRFTFKGNSEVLFINNSAYPDDGGAWILNTCSIKFQDNSKVFFNGNSANDDGGAVRMMYSTAAFEDNSTTIFNVNNVYNRGGAVYIKSHSNITFTKHSAVTFLNNSAVKGGAMAISDGSSIIFKENSTVKFNANTAFQGGAAYTRTNSIILFKGNSRVLFNNNKANPYDGGALAIYVCSITFEENSTITFIGNRAYRFGGAIRIITSVVTFGGNSDVTFNNNKADQEGGAIRIITSVVTFGGNSDVTFNNNKADQEGGACYIDYSAITFQGNSTVTFLQQLAATNGGVMYADNYSNITFQGNSKVAFNDNSASYGGVMYAYYHSTITFQGDSIVTFNNNDAVHNGGVIYNTYCSTITFQGNSTVTFNDNHAESDGGVIRIDDSIYNHNIRTTILFKGSSTVKFNDNHAYRYGGSMYIVNSSVTFEGTSTVTFKHNEAYNGQGGALYIIDYSTVTFKGNSTIVLNKNKASNHGVHVATLTSINNDLCNNGGVMHISSYSIITFEGNSIVKFNDNSASNGGVMFIDYHSIITFQENSTVQFNCNAARSNGGVMYVDNHSTITFQGYSTIYFHKNKVDYNGGSLYVNNNSTVKLGENSKILFAGNTAGLGGGVFCKYSCITIDGNSFVKFINNTAYHDGGAIYLSDHSNFTQLNYSNITFNTNRARDYGSAIYTLFKGNLLNFGSCNFDNIFEDNTARTIQNSVYINVPKSCNSNCIFDNINILNEDHFPIVTSPNKLILYNPAKCINDDDTDCDTYYMNNIMLGQEITFYACLLDYYDQPTEATQFLITGMNHQDYNISGSKYITITCNRTTQGISVIGNLGPNNSYNYSIIISLHFAHISERSKIIVVNLTFEISQCHPGFLYFSGSHKCKCYDTENIISCSGRNSTIKRGYWFGSVLGKTTITSCPNDYCNFTCCEITNGIYHLSPVRANQCRPHRTGTACGDCEKGYTLSFDSLECVEVNECTIGIILVTIVSLLYWIVVVVAVFAMMHFKVTIGPLYAIVYYYSVVDILLSRVLFVSNGLYTTVSIMSSLAKLTPKFLGQLCLVRNMSGIDQQFIHYVHPLVILFILIMISVIARRSHRISSFISRGIIPFLCFLLLLSYTSVATTSLLLMRPLSFVDIDKVYTYLSPDIEYFHGRHLVYVIAAIVCTIVIVIGFPLLLLLEPFLNSKINFIKIKPLLDQFQGCYKDKYRCFAGYYMICRLVIILLIMVKISDNFTTQYLLMSSCALMQLIHLLVRPYVSTIHNIFDGIILQLIVIISVLPIVEFVDNYDESFVLVIIYLLVILPLTTYISIKLWINRKEIQYIMNYLRTKCYNCKYNLIPTDDPEDSIEGNEFSIVIDDSMRRNTMIVDV